MANNGLLSAFEVFTSFVHISRANSGTIIDVRDVFSPKCFTKWLETRPGDLQHPEQTFHRTLIAHIRGADSRKPFPKEIEQELLILLRDEKINVWDAVFNDEPEGNKFHIGSKGFKHFGFHESSHIVTEDEDGVKTKRKGPIKIRKSRTKKPKIRLDNDEPEIENVSSQSSRSRTTKVSIDSGSDVNEGKPILKLKKRRKPGETSVIFDATPETCPETDSVGSRRLSSASDLLLPQPQLFNSDLNILNQIMTPGNSISNTPTPRGFLMAEDLLSKSVWMDLIRNNLYTSYPGSGTSPTIASSNSSSPDLDTATGMDNMHAELIRTLKNRKVLNPWDEFLGILKQFNLPDFIANVETTGKKHGVDMLSPALIFMMKQPTPTNDPRFDLSFLYPKESENIFLPDRPRGMFLIDLTTHTYIDCSPTGRILLRGNPVGQFWMSLHSSLYELWFGSIPFLELLVKQQTHWKRSVRMRCDGSVGMFNTRVEVLDNSTKLRVEFQDVSDLYDDFLSRPYLL